MARNAPRPAAMGLLLDFGAGVSVDFEADRDLDDPRLQPLLHADLPTALLAKRRKLGKPRRSVNARI